MTPTESFEDRYFEIAWAAGDALGAGNLPEFRRLLPTVIAMTADLVVIPETEQKKSETVAWYRSLETMTDAQLEAAGMTS